MHILSFAIDIVLAVYVVWEVVWFLPQYRQLKQAIAKGDVHARTRVYWRAMVFEWVSALLALLALGFDWSKLNPKFLALENSRLIQMIPRGGDFEGGAIGGIVLGLVLGTVGLAIARLRSKRRGATSAPVLPAAGWRKLLPDFSALIPVTTRERLLWAAVAVSAGICEEVVFRGWLLSTLHGPFGLGGTALIVVAATIFGLAHAYQGIAGVVLTAFAGAVFGGIYVVTGSLLVPILLHVLIDVRFAVLPAPRTQDPQPAYA
jgi:uncharacterized protein